MNEDYSHSNSNPHPEAVIFNNQMTQNSGPEDGHDTRGTFCEKSFRKKFYVYFYLDFQKLLDIERVFLTGLSKLHCTCPGEHSGEIKK